MDSFLFVDSSNALFQDDSLISKYCINDKSSVSKTITEYPLPQNTLQRFQSDMGSEIKSFKKQEILQANASRDSIYSDLNNITSLKS